MQPLAGAAGEHDHEGFVEQGMHEAGSCRARAVAAGGSRWRRHNCKRIWMIARGGCLFRRGRELFDLTGGDAYYELFIGTAGAVWSKRSGSSAAMFNRQNIGLSLVVMLALSTTSGLFAQKKDDKKQTDDQKRDIQAMVKAVDDAAAGQAAPNDFGLSWTHEDFMKAQGNKEYAPFSVTIDPSKTMAGTVAFYWRVVSKDAPPPAPPPADSKDKDKKDDKKAPPKREFPYEDISFVPVVKGGPMRITRSVTVPAGAYDVYVAVKEPTPASKDKNPPPAAKMSIVKQSLTVPDFWNGELNTSSIIVAQRIEPLAAPLTPQQQVERPYALGGLEIVPVTETDGKTKLSKTAELQTFMIIYNPKTENNKPDVTVEYSFYTKSAGTEKFFNKTAAQSLNAQTLPPQFDVAAGHQLQAGQGVPLGSFPEGEYRLEIKVTDNLAKKSLTRDVSFVVSGS
jgi:hypothetical protein